MSFPNEVVPDDKAARIASLRQRYLELKAVGEAPAAALPPLSARALAQSFSGPVLHRETIPGGWYTALRLARGTSLRLVNTAATPGVSVLLWNADDTSERYNAGDTVKVQWTAALTCGRLLFSDMGRVLASITEDSCGAHDALVGGSTAASNLAKYGAPCGDAGLRNTRDNLLLAAAKFGLTRRDLAACLTFFAPVVTDDTGRFAWQHGRVQPGDFVELRAEMNLCVAISNSPHPLAPDTMFAPEAIDAVIHRAAAPPADDPCRTRTAEARRGIENTQSFFTVTGAAS